MLTEIRKRAHDRRQRARMTRTIAAANPVVCDELIVLAQHQGLL